MSTTPEACAVCYNPAMRRASLKEIQDAWHDVTCPEGAGCRSRSLHAQAGTMDPTLTQFLDALGAVVPDTRSTHATGPHGWWSALDQEAPDDHQ